MMTFVFVVSLLVVGLGLLGLVMRFVPYRIYALPKHLSKIAFLTRLVALRH